MDNLLTAAELAPLLGLPSENVVHRWKREGRIPAAVDEGRIVRFDLAECRAALARRAEKARQARTPIYP